jgi:23S rRNA pseudouridine1911/1915/1917 synthase
LKEKRKSLLDRIEVIYEDVDLVVIEKANGILSYPQDGDRTESAIQLIRRYWKTRDLPHQNLYLIHRLDKDTSGLMVFAKTSLARHSLQRQFEQHSVVRGYAAVCGGIPRNDYGTMKTLLGRGRGGKRTVTQKGRLAITSYTVESRNVQKQRSLIRCFLRTGRTHQVRIHLAHLGTPVIGDAIYGKIHASRLGLHAEILGFIHPRTNGPLLFRSSLPPEVKMLL